MEFKYLYKSWPDKYWCMPSNAFHVYSIDQFIIADDALRSTIKSVDIEEFLSLLEMRFDLQRRNAGIQPLCAEAHRMYITTGSRPFTLS